MSKVTGAFAIQNFEIHAKRLEQLGQDDTANRVDGVSTDTELAFGNSLTVHQFQIKHGVDMTLVISIIDGTGTQVVNFCIVKILCLSHTEHLSAIGSCKELALTVEQLQSVPLSGVVRCGNDDTAISASHAYSQLGSWGRSITNIYDIVAHTHKGTHYNVTNNKAGDTTITANDYLFTTNKLSISCGKLNNV